MFKGGQPNPYDEIVAKTTDENLTSENWELILNLCDQVQDEGEQGARNVINAVLKRLAHRNPNVQLYALALVEALSKNCGISVHREIASRSFTQGLERLVTDRTSHEKVKRKALSLVNMWTIDFENDPTLGIMEECYDNLRGKGYKFEEPQEPPPPQVDDEIRRREEEELQRVLEMSVHDKGGRPAWDSSYGAVGSSSSAGPSSSSKPAASSSKPVDTSVPSSQYGTNDYGYAKSTSGYVPARTPSPEVRMTPAPAVAATPAYTAAAPAYAAAPSPQTQQNSSSQSSLALSSVSRVRALHTFEGSEQGELSFIKGDIIKVVDRNYKDWWRGQLKGRTGIFPVNYVELLPDPTPEEIAREAEQEAAIFGQAANIDKLLNMLRSFDPERDNLADNEEIQELYRNGMTLRPKIVKLIEKYSQKRDELVLMNDSFVKARTMFDRMMEESLARHTGLYDGRSPYQPPRQDYRAPVYGGGYDQPYTPFPQPNAGYQIPTSQPGPQQYAAPAYTAQQANYRPYPTQQTPAPYGPAEAPSYGPYVQPPHSQQATSPQPQAQPQTQPQSPQVKTEAMYASFANMNINQPQQSPQPQVQSTTQYPQQSQPQQNGYSEPLPATQPQVQIQNQYQQQQVQQQQQPSSPSRMQAQGQQQPESQGPVAAQQPQQQIVGPKTITQGPPYIFDPNATYPDPNAQAWAQYYAQGGTDLTGAVYFISVPGLTDKAPVSAAVSVASQVQGQADQYAGQQQRPYGQETERKTSYGSMEAQPQPQAQVQVQPQPQYQPQPQSQSQPQPQESPQHYPGQVIQTQTHPSPYQLQSQPQSPQQQQQSVQIPTQPQPNISSSPIQTQIPQTIYQEPVSTAAVT